MKTLRTAIPALLSVATLVACGSANSTDIPPLVGDVTDEELANRAYVISENSDELFVADLSDMSMVASISTTVDSGNVDAGNNANHMAILSPQGRKIFITATDKNSVVVVDAISLEITNTIELGQHPTHAAACFDCAPFGRDELWVVNEGGEHGHDDLEGDNEEHTAPVPGSITIIDMNTDEVLRTIEDDSLLVPHFVRFSNGKAYVPSIGGNQITVIDLDTYEAADVLVVDSAEGMGACEADPCGFADAQIDGNGLLMAAHIETGNVLVYDTIAERRLADIKPIVPGGSRPWSVFVDPLSNDSDLHFMPNWQDSTVSLLNRVSQREEARSPEGDIESYGVNYSPNAPDQAFILNRIKEQVAVVDRTTGQLVEALDVGGTTETASTTADGRFLLVPVSSSNEFTVLDAVTREEVARFQNVGEYPWSVTTVGGQNYCH